MCCFQRAFVYLLILFLLEFVIFFCLLEFVILFHRAGRDTLQSYYFFLSKGKVKQTTAPQQQESESKVSINITDLDIFIDLVRLIKEMTKDERIEESIREEYRQKVLAVN